MPDRRCAWSTRAADALAAVAGRCLAAATPSAASVSDELDRAAADVVDGRGDAVSALLEGLHLSHLRPKFAEEDVRDLATCALLESDELERLGLDADAAARRGGGHRAGAALAAPAGLLDAVAAGGRRPPPCPGAGGPPGSRRSRRGPRWTRATARAGGSTAS